MAEPRKRPPRATRRRRLIAGGAIASAVVLAAVAAVALWPRGAAADGPPAPGTRVLASQDSKAHHAAAQSAPDSADHRAATFLSRQPTAFWLTPESEPVDRIGATIARLAEEARTQSARLAVVVYGLPGRDCGNFSAGGLAPSAYADWTSAIGEALREAADVGPIVILEPDSLALATECGNVQDRTIQLRGAVGALAGESTWIYVDGGHSNWLPPAEMARLIDDLGHRDEIRGFATNVSNYNDTDAEVAYAHDLSARLNGMHALVDTSRNGAGSDGQWCNPPGRLVGQDGGSIGDGVVDTNLWIKPPGESDGSCNGGPAAGRWWPEGAVSLVREAVFE